MHARSRSSAASRPGGPAIRRSPTRPMGMDAYIVAFGLIAIAMILVGINMIVTIVNMRAPGLTWARLPIFVWSMLATVGADGARARRCSSRGLLMEALDRTASTSFFLAATGGSPFLYENIFWFFGHPEVYILALPGFGVVLEILPVFARKPLWGYRLAVAGMLGVSLLSLHGLAAPPVRERHQLESAAVLHVHDRAHLGAHRVHLPRRRWGRSGGPASATRCRCCSRSRSSSTS